jgi:ATP-binding cassette subfamily B (MDR/TAP) protein 1
MMGACVLSSIGAGVAMPLSFIVLGRLVGNFTGYFTPGTTVTEHQFMHQVQINAIFMTAIASARFLLDYISLLSIRMSGLRISAKLRLAYLTALFKQPVSVIDRTSPGKIATRLTSNANTIQMGISQQLASMIQQIALTLGLYVVSFIRGPLLTLVASSSLLFTIIVYSLVVPIVFGNQKKAEKFKELASALSFEIFTSIRIVTAFGAEDRLARKHLDFLESARTIERASGPYLGLMMAPMFFSMYASFALTFWFGIKEVTNGHLPGIGSIVVVLFSVNFAATGLGRLVGPLMGVLRAATAAGEIFLAIDSPVPDMTGLKGSDVSVNEDIEFRNVRFAYPTRPDTQILKGLSVTFEKGKKTAIVGPSGSGKSTVVGLIQRWYEPSDLDADTKSEEDRKPSETEKISTDEDASAGVFIGQLSLKTIDAKFWRKQVGLVQQEPFLFNDTIFNNVANGLSGTQWEDLPKEDKMTMVENACKEAYADNFIVKLPEGYETLVGESGIKISGGQRQRLAIARAIIRQPTILILDEATSAIDVRSERIVQKALDRVSENRTTITIAHRLSTIKRADKIVVLRAGEIVESGTHNELLQNSAGVYSGLVKAQSLTMGEDDLEKDENQKDELEQIEEEEKIHKVKTEEARAEEVQYKERGVLASFGLLIYEQKHRWILYSIIIIACATNGATYPVQSYLFAHLINVFTLTGAALVSRGNFWALMLFTLACVTGIAYWVMGWCGHIISVSVACFYRQEYLVNLLRKRITYFDGEGKSPGTLSSHLSINATQLQELLGNNMSLAVVAVFNLIGSITISFYFGWKLALVGVLCLMPIVLAAGYFRVSMERGFQKLNAAVFEESSQFGSEAVSAFRTVTSLLMEDKILLRFNILLETHAKDAFKRARWTTLIFAFSDTAEMFCQALCFYYGGTLLAKREYDVVTYFVIYMSAIQGAQAAGMWFSFAPNIVEATAAANRILSARPTKSDLAYNPPSMEEGEGAASLEFRDVSFSYKDRNVPVLSNISFSIAPGSFAALVGASGCGKSTIISLLERFYDPTHGTILFDGKDITEYSSASYRKNLSLVAQESTLYEGTIAENVALSVPVDLATPDKIQAACESAQIHEFITSLPQGYDTLIGPRGIELSGGQRQRVALARALLRKPQILLLDEATSNLDSESEAQVQAAIEKAAGDGGRTVIAVAHRLATIQKADVILVIGSGGVLEQGSHAVLLAKRGVYYQMVSSFLFRFGLYGTNLCSVKRKLWTGRGN